MTGDRGPPSSVVDLVEAQVDRSREALAVVGDDAVMTYGELDELANRIGHAVDRADPGRTRVHGGVLVGTGARPVVAMLGVVKSGRTVVPLDTDSPPERLVELGRQVGPMVVVTDRQHAALLDPTTPTVVLEELADDLPADRPTPSIGPDDGFLVNFTSGSTGRPKGALRSHRAQMYGVHRHASVSGYRPGVRLGLVHGVAFAASRVTIWCGLGNGCSIHVRDVRANGPRGLASWLADQRIEVVQAPASLIDAMVEQDPPEGVLEDLDRITFSGDVLRVDTVRRLRPFLRPDAEIQNSYGSSEVGGVATFRMRADDPLEGELVPAGRIREDAEVRIVDPDGRGVGEIEVSGMMVAVRYVDDSTDARGSYRNDGGRRWIRSGDLGRVRADGLLEVCGRLDDRVKIRAQTIDPAEVERALRRRPDVADVHVGGRPVRGQDRLVAWVEPTPGSSPTVTGLRAGLRDELPGWMVPQSVIVLDRLPRTERGKVDRAGLPAPGSERPSLGPPFERPRTPLEQRLAEAFGDVLGVEGVGRDDEFLDLGGDSLAAVELIDHVSRALGRDLPMDAFLEAATPQALAARLQAEPQGADDRLVALQPGGDGVPVVLVHAGHGFVITYGHLARSLAGRRPAFGVQMLTRDPARDLFSLPRLARRYADLLDRRLPGPLVIAGFSGGSPLAHALTAELAGRGRSVPACVLLDPVGPGRRRRPTKALAYDLVSCTPVRLRPHRVTQQRMAAAERGSRRYRPDAIPVPIVMARAELAGPERWATLTSAGLTVVDVPGDHVSMLHPPHSVVLGERLEPLLQRLQSECPSIPAGSGDR